MYFEKNRVQVVRCERLWGELGARMPGGFVCPGQGGWGVGLGVQTPGSSPSFGQGTGVWWAEAGGPGYLGSLLQLWLKTWDLVG